MKFYKINKSFWLVSQWMILIYSIAFANSSTAGLAMGKSIFTIHGINPEHFGPNRILMPVYNNSLKDNNVVQKNTFGWNLLDSLPKTIKNTVVIPFEYKQSALYHPFTFKAIDSVIDILLENELVTLSLEGFAHVDEGSDSICYYLSLNRALVIKDYIMGRGVDSSRILSLRGLGNMRSIKRKARTQSVDFNCRTEISMNYPIPPPPLVISDKDDDGIIDGEDQCPEEYGGMINRGCPNRNAILVPYEPGQSSLFTMTYKVLDSVINILLQNPSILIAIEGHACNREGIETYCDHLAKERAEITKRYLLTRSIAALRIISVKSFGDSRPLNACKNPQQIAQNSRAEIYLQHP